MFRDAIARCAEAHAAARSRLLESAGDDDALGLLESTWDAAPDPEREASRRAVERALVVETDVGRQARLDRLRRR